MWITVPYDGAKETLPASFPSWSHPASPLHRMKAAKTRSSSTCWCCWETKKKKKKRLTDTVTSSGEGVHYSSLSSTIHQTDGNLGITLQWSLTSVEMVSRSSFFLICDAYVNQSKCWTSLSLANLPLHQPCRARNDILTETGETD